MGCQSEDINEISGTYIDFIIDEKPVFISDISLIIIDPNNQGLSQESNPKICATRSSFIESNFNINGEDKIFLWRFTDIQIEHLECEINSNNYLNVVPVGNDFRFLNSANDCFGNTGIGEPNTILFNIGDGVSSRSDFGCQSSDSFFEILSVVPLETKEEPDALYPMIMEAGFKFTTYRSVSYTHLTLPTKA